MQSKPDSRTVQEIAEGLLHRPTEDGMNFDQRVEEREKHGQLKKGEKALRNVLQAVWETGSAGGDVSLRRSLLTLAALVADAESTRDMQEQLSSPDHPPKSQTQSNVDIFTRFFGPRPEGQEREVADLVGTYAIIVNNLRHMEVDLRLLLEIAYCTH